MSGWSRIDGARRGKEVREYRNRELILPSRTRKADECLRKCRRKVRESTGRMWKRPEATAAAQAKYSSQCKILHGSCREAGPGYFPVPSIVYTAVIGIPELPFSENIALPARNEKERAEARPFPQ